MTTTNSKTINTELAVIGAGPGGYAAAFHAADKGMKVTLINDQPEPGGICLHVGCIPSKAALHIAKLIEDAKTANEIGLHFGEPRIDLAAIRAWKDKVVNKLVGGVHQLCKSRGVQYVQGRAVFIDSERLAIEDSEIEMVCFQHAILATGSSPISLRGMDLKSPRLMDSTRALAIEEIPKTMLVIGGGYIGLELATVYAALGSKITIVEMTDGLLPGVDRDLVRPLAARMKNLAQAIYLETKVTKIEEVAEGLKVTMEGKAGTPEQMAEQIFDRALVAVGRKPNSHGLGLENTRAVVNQKGFVEVNAQRRTGDERIYAIGDVAGEPMLAHKATREGIVAAEAIAGEPAAFDPAAIPAVVFTDPEIAWCGLTEMEAKRQNITVKVARFPWGASGRAITVNRTDGTTKIICDAESEVVLGMGVVGPGAGEMIAEGVLAIEMGATAEDLASTIHAHPTLTETVMEGAELIFGSATHLYRPPRAR